MVINRPVQQDCPNPPVPRSSPDWDARVSWFMHILIKSETKHGPCPVTRWQTKVIILFDFFFDRYWQVTSQRTNVDLWWLKIDENMITNWWKRPKRNRAMIRCSTVVQCHFLTILVNSGSVGWNSQVIHQQFSCQKCNKNEFTMKVVSDDADDMAQVECTCKCGHTVKNSIGRSAPASRKNSQLNTQSTLPN